MKTVDGKNDVNVLAIVKEVMKESNAIVARWGLGWNFSVVLTCGQ